MRYHVYMQSYNIVIVELWGTYAAADEVDLLGAVDPNIKPAAVGHQETCWTNEGAAGEWYTTLQMLAFIYSFPAQKQCCHIAVLLFFLNMAGLGMFKAKKSNT